MGNVKLEGSGPVVMVDDDEVDILVARKCHGRSRVPNAFVSFRSGPAFLAHLDAVERGEDEMPAVVLLDINMPEMDGFAVLEETRKRQDFRTLPVITMLTNSDNPQDVARSTAAGADGFNVKPVRAEEFVAFFDSLLPDAGDEASSEGGTGRTGGTGRG